MTRNPLLRNVWIGVALSAAMAVIVTGLLLMPAMPGKPLPVPFVDKAVHAALFFAVACPAMVSLRRVWHGPIFALVVGYGGVTELVQPSFGRSAEWADLVADALGAGLAVLVARRIVSEPPEIPQRQRPQADDGLGHGQR